MPELPEMEHYRQQLSRMILHRPITAIQITREKSLNMPAHEFERRVIGTSITQITRRAKYLLFHLQSGEILLLHLMLGGLIFYGTEQEKPERTIQITLTFQTESLYLIGLRLGFLHLISPQEVEQKLAHLGPEPLGAGFSMAMLKQQLHGRRGVLKTILVNQDLIAGIGNCYADEICFEARLLPTRTVQSLSEPEWESLYEAILHTLREALRYGGYMEVPLMANDLLTGAYNDRCKVYDREAETCVRCGGTIQRAEMSGRKCFYCTGCQH